MTLLKFLVKSRFSYFDNVCLVFCIVMGGWWLLALFPLAILSVVFEMLSNRKGNQPS